MEIALKCLPFGSLPYEDLQIGAKMMLKVYEQSPYLACFPNIDPDDNLVNRTLKNIPGIKIKNEQILYKGNSDKTKQELLKIDSIFLNPTAEALEEYAIEAPFVEKFCQVLNRAKPKEAIINILGPVSISQMISTKDEPPSLSDKFFRKFLIQTVCIKALWAIAKIREYSPDTMPIIVLEEPLLHKIGDIKRNNEDISNDTIISLYSKIIQKLKEYRSAVAVQSFSKCDWTIPIEAGVDIISFDAYNNPNNLNIIAEKVNNFLIGGGHINWAIIPVTTEERVKKLKIDDIVLKFTKTVEELVASGVNERFAFSRAIVSVQGDTSHLPIIFAEKVLLLSAQLSKKIPNKMKRLL